jgi:rod shape-determining protein MreD
MARCIVAGVIATYLLAVFQTTIGELMMIRGVTPDLLFVWTVCLGLLSGRTAGALIGFGCGLLEGGLTQQWIGAFAISKALSGFGAGVLGAKLFKENWAVPSVAAALLTVANESVFVLVSSSDGWPRAGHLILVRSLYHAALAPIIFALTLRARRLLVGRREELA